MKVGFSKKAVEAMLCQRDKASLTIKQIESGDEKVIFSGSLKCSACEQEYQIKDGILDLLVGQSDLPDIMKDEIEARDKEANTYDQRLSTRYHKEIPSTLSALGNLQGKKVMEYGCGTGRLTEILVKRSELIVANDFSRESLSILAEKLNGCENVALVLADSVQLRTKEKYFDIVCSFQFLEHVPTAGQRANFIEHAKNTLLDKGTLVLSVYHFDLRRQKNNESIEGMHSSGIFFHYFNIGEMSEEMHKYFNYVKIKPIDITLPLEARMKLPIKLSGFLSRLFENLPYLNRFGHLLLIQAKK